ncbi:MAG: hypothetical protein JWP01_3841 [Myxococcales bacterium]|nr:hypothetical protein [Myxococcales bacterium]
MLVFGDQILVASPRPVARELERVLTELASRPAGIDRHSALVAAFIDASELTQGLADAECATTGIETRGLVGDVAMSMLLALARQIAESWRSGFQFCPHPPRTLGVLRMLPMPDVVNLRQAEGHAYYAVYPEAYLEAATAAVARHPGPRHVIGIRSIGTGLAAMVAAATDAGLPATVRPRGDPFRRTVQVSEALAAEWRAHPDTTIAVVDEGPGMSGSSFGAVVDTLEDLGITRIECFPSHRGELGAMASERHRVRWQRLPRHVVEVDQLLVDTDLLAGWIADIVGPLLGPLEDLSAGAWRALRFRDDRMWPASVTFQERRKFLARTSDAAWLARFVGLGRAGARSLTRARTLHAAGFTPPIAGLCHGFLLERWFDDAVPLDLRLYERPALVGHVARYLALRSSILITAEPGASLPKLLEMARHNTTLALGARTAAAFDRFAPRLASLARSVRAIEIDGRLHVWEWLVRADGSLVKTDALDHHAAHDLVGCQDLTWDLAGAGYELEMSHHEQHRLASTVAAITGRAHDPELLRFMRLCYLAFQLGRHALAIDTADAAEAVRLRLITDRYAAALGTALR